MAAPTVTISNPSTADGASSSSPYKVSHQTGKGDFSFDFSIAFSGTLTYRQVRVGGANRKAGTRLRRLGAICGFGQRCGMGERPLALTSSPNTGSVTLAEVDDLLVDGEGEYRVGMDARNGDGWSATD